MGIYQVVIIAILGIAVAGIIKGYRPEYAMYMSLCISFIIFTFVMTMISEAKSQFQILADFMSGNEKYYGMLFKMMGITYLCEFCAGICKDAGHQAIAGQVEMFGKITILLSGIPILLALVETIQKFTIAS